MWFSLLGLLRARRGRKAAVSVIAPLVDSSRYRLNGIREDVWLEPYMVGFIVMLISLIARRRVSDLSGQTLGLVQAEAWTDITGLPPELLAEQVLHLSAVRHNAFEAGCHRAADIERALSSATTQREDLASGTHPRCSAGAQDVFERQLVFSLWQEFFDAHLTGT